MIGIVAKSWLEWVVGTEAGAVPRPPEAGVLVVHDAVPTAHGKANISWAIWSTEIIPPRTQLP